VYVITAVGLCFLVVIFSGDFLTLFVILSDDCSINSNPIAASTRVSALNIVADLLKKLDVSDRGSLAGKDSPSSIELEGVIGRKWGVGR
jgi:hypothetical protein